MGKDGTQIATLVGCTCIVSRRFRGYNDLAVKRALGVPRFTQEGMRNVPSIVAPSLLRKGETEQLFLFHWTGDYDNDDEGHDVTLQNRLSCRLAV